MKTKQRFKTGKQTDKTNKKQWENHSNLNLHLNEEGKECLKEFWQVDTEVVGKREGFF